MKTRAQKDAELAYQQILPIKGMNAELVTTYVGLCRHFPMLVLRSGLSQAVAFYVFKATPEKDGKADPKKQAYQYYLQHMAKACSCGDIHYTDFQQHLHRIDAMAYLQVTRRILAAAIWYKRYATSVLNVDHQGDE